MRERGRWIRGIIVGLSVGVSGAILALSPFQQPLETYVGLHTLFHLRGVQQPPPEVVLVAIERQTGEKLGLANLPRDWPRSIHGKLIDELVKRGAAAIVFDMDFRKSRDKQQDLLFSQSVAKSDRVILFEHLNGRRQNIEDKDGRIQGSVWIEELEQPLPVLAKSAKAIGSFTLPKTDASVDQFWTFKSSIRDKPTIPAVALQVYTLQFYSQWRDLISKSTRENLDWMPQSASAIHDAQELNSLMMGTRRLFEQDPTLHDHILTSSEDILSNGESGRILSSLLSLYAGNNDRYLNFYGPTNTILTVPYHAVIKGDAPNLPKDAMDFTGKVVFVGYADPLDPGLLDHFYTVFTRDDGVDISGVEIAATSFANLLTDQTVKPLGPASTLLLVLAFGMTTGVLVYLIPAVPAVTLTIGLSLAYAISAQLNFNANGSWWPLAIPLLVQLPLSLFIGLISQYRLQKHRVNHISEAIRQYVPDSVSRILTTTNLDADSVNKVTYGTCLATDMAGFSTIAESMNPGDLARFLNEYFEVLAKALKRHGVEVTEFRADAIMCAWTGDADDESVRSLPVVAALEAAKEISIFNIQRDLSGSLRVGLADGEFYVGHAGGGGRFVYSIVGDCANTASRIESLNKQLGTSILSTSTVLVGQDHILTRYLGRFRFVGKTEALAISEILASRSTATAAQIDLCTRFSSAQKAFEQGDWPSAIEKFEHLLLDFPQDSPTRFLLARCRMHINEEAGSSEAGIITLTSK